MAHIKTTNFYSNPNIGLYAFATDSYCLIGYDFKKRIMKEIEDILKVPVHYITIVGTPMIGAFTTGNNNCLLVPSIAFEEELEKLDKLGIKYKVIDTKLTALGNNILCNDHGCIINPDFTEKEKKEIKDALGVKTVASEIAGINIVGSAAVANKTHCLIHWGAEKKELSLVKKTLNVEIETGTINMANPYISSGIICNSNGLLVGDASGGPEVVNADEALGYLERLGGK